MTTTTSGSEAVWRRIAPIYDDILVHPFLTGITDGSLPPEAFARYVVQDGLYLREYARSLSLCAARGLDTDTVEMFASHASVAIQVERTLHTDLLRGLDLDPDELAAIPLTPTCTAYTNFIKQACALGERHCAIAAVLPCYWIYHEVGHTLIATGSPNEVYQRWIDTYADEAFAESVRGALGACDAVAADLGPAALEEMTATAEMAARYEWMFWDSAFRDERWPRLGDAG
jgi:thiaminase/transcriptional activator TenA